MAKCPICGAEATLYAKGLYELDGVGYDLVRCSGCKVVCVDPFPDEKRVAALYDDKYFEKDYSFGIVDGDYLASEVARESEYRRILSRIARLTPGRNMLEVGCAAGAFLKEASSQGWNVTGVDVSPWAVKTAREKFALDVREGTLVDQEFPAAKFDAVFFGDLLEHLPDPVAFLREAARVVKPHSEGGVVVAKVPTYVNSFYYRWLKKGTNVLSFGGYSGDMMQLLKLSDTAKRMPPYHLFEYNPSSVGYVFNKAGLVVFEEEKTLMIPEFLHTQKSLGGMFLSMLFGAMKFMIESFNLPGGHVLVFATPSNEGGFI